MSEAISAKSYSGFWAARCLLLLRPLSFQTKPRHRPSACSGGRVGAPGVRTGADSPHRPPNLTPKAAQGSRMGLGSAG